MRELSPGAFAVWITGRPAAGKTTLTAALAARLADHGVRCAVLESDAWRKVLTPSPTYTEEERRGFYGALVSIGALLVEHGVPVIFDATAPRREHRQAARRCIERFIEVEVDCALELCVARDPKGIYRKAREGEALTVPGLQVPYEPPESADVVVDGARGAPEAASARIVAVLEARGFLAASAKGLG